MRVEVAALALLVSASAAAAPPTLHAIEVGGLRRTYFLHVPPGLPPDRPVALVLAFHGGDLLHSDAAGARMERLTGLDALADREGFLVAYPNGTHGNWNDGRDPSVSAAHREGVDDVGFVSALIDDVAARFPVDLKRVYATGISNGAIFSHALAARLARRIAAIAPVAGGIAEPFDRAFHPERPVSVLIVQGTADPLVPFHGGAVAGGRRGRIVDTDRAVEMWSAVDAPSGPLRREVLARPVASDGCTVLETRWTGGRSGTEIALVTLKGGGHTWPGGPQYLPRSLIGKACSEIDASELIWRFFAAHPQR